MNVQQPLQDALRQRGAFGWISACAKLIKEHQILRRYLLHDGHDVLHMPGERGQALFDGLLIANIGKDLLKHRHFRADIRRKL